MTDPLRTISGFAEVLVETDPSPEERQEYTRHILDSSLRLAAMLQGLLAYARADQSTGRAEALELATVVNQVRDDLAISIREGKAELVVELPAEATAVFEPSDLRVIFQNLISNAIKFGDPQAPVVVVGADRTGDSWLVTVRDNGAGIAAEDHARIFGAFERGPSAEVQLGYGLGLAICQRLVERGGGRIGIDSDPGEGASIWFTLPAAHHASGADIAASAPPTSPAA